MKKEQGIDDLENKIFKLLKKNNKMSYFINEVLLKFFSFQINKLVQFKETSANVQLPQSIEAEPDIQKNKLQIVSSHFKDIHQTNLIANLPSLCDQKTIKMFKSLKWEKVYSTSGQSKDFQALLKTLTENKPFMILLQCQNIAQDNLLGIFSSAGFQMKPKSTTDAYVPLSDNHFLFYYTHDHQYKHYKFSPLVQEQFLEFSLVHENESITFSYENQEKIFISLVDDQHTVDLYPMKPIEQKEFDFPYDLHLVGFEIFQLQLKQEDAYQQSDDVFYSKLKNNIIEGGLLNQCQSFYKYDPIFNLFGELSVAQIEKALSLKAINVSEENKQKKLKQCPESPFLLEYSGFLPQLTKESFQD